MIKQLVQLIKKIISKEPLDERLEFEFEITIYDAIAISVILVMLWWVIFK